MIGLGEHSPLQRLIDEQAHALGVTPTYRVRLPTLDAVHAVAGTGAGTAVISYGTIRRLRAAPDTVHPIDADWARRQAMLITRTAFVPSSAQQQFIEALLRYRDEQDAPG